MRTYTHKAMDTEFSVSFGLTGADVACASAAAMCFDRIDALEQLLTRFSDASDVAVIRALKPGEVAIVARETMAVLVTSAEVCAATGGAFDPTVGPIMDRLREHGVTWQALTDDERMDALARGGLNRLILDVEHLRVAVREDRLGRATPLELDFGGIGKGFALDACAEILRGEQYELVDWMVDGGTSTQLVSGSMDPAQGVGWPIGVGGVWKDRTRIDTVVQLKDRAISGSGYELRGRHVVDVRKGCAAARWAQAWSQAPTAAVADALSTAALALEPKEISAACAALNARVLVAREQAPFLDRFRDPLVWYGAALD